MDITEKKKKILNSNGSFEVEHYYNYIKEGIVTLQELKEHGLDKYPDKIKYIASQMSAGEQSAWKDAQKFNTVNSYDMFLSMFPNSEHAGEAREALVALEDSYWMQVKDSMSEQSLNNYKRIYPEGKYVAQCDALVSDLPWKEANRRNTIEAYRTYEANNPGKHSEEIRKAIADIEDNNDWQYFSQINTVSAYKEYLKRHPNGLYVDTCYHRINDVGKDEVILAQLKKDDNMYMASELQEKVENGIITWNRLGEVFNDAQLQAIKDWRKMPDLPECTPPKSLRKDSTEVYFWGTRKTGKTCAMGAVLSSAKSEGIMAARSCRHRVYMDQLSNLFAGSGQQIICNLPGGTSKDSIAEMNLQFFDKKKKKHNATFIDLAGEVVTGIYKIQNNIPLVTQEEETINKVLEYLRNPYNNKIHFFVLEYGEAHKEVKELADIGIPNIQQVNVLAAIAEFLQEKKIFKKSTVGVYGLVTKSDTIDMINGTSAEERPKLANEYVKTELKSFWDPLNYACEEANIKDVKTVAFSIGDVFAQNLCIFDGSDSKKIVDRLILKIPSEHEGWFKWLFK